MGLQNLETVSRRVCLELRSDPGYRSYGAAGRRACIGFREEGLGKRVSRV